MRSEERCVYSRDRSAVGQKRQQMVISTVNVAYSFSAV